MAFLAVEMYMVVIVVEMMVVAVAKFILGDTTTVFHQMHEVMARENCKDAKNAGALEGFEFRLQFDKAFWRGSIHQSPHHKYSV